MHKQENLYEAIFLELGVADSRVFAIQVRVEPQVVRGRLGERGAGLDLGHEVWVAQKRAAKGDEISFAASDGGGGFLGGVAVVKNKKKPGLAAATGASRTARGDRNGPAAANKGNVRRELLARVSQRETALGGHKLVRAATQTSYRWQPGSPINRPRQHCENAHPNARPSTTWTYETPS